jgi:hypothetical protein
VVNVLLLWTVSVTVPIGGNEDVVGGDGAAGGGIEDVGGAAEEEGGGRNPLTESVVSLANTDGDELGDEMEVLKLATVAVELKVKPSSLAANEFPAQPTYTPRVLVSGSAKHPALEPQTWTILKLPWLSHDPTLPAMQASSPPVHGDEKLSVAKRSL